MRVNPYLTFDGDCEEAFKVYEKVLGGKIVAMMTQKDTPAEAHVPAEWRDKILHARLVFGDNVLMASDAPPGHREKIVFNVPLNKRLASVTPESAEGAAVWTRYLSAWTASNHVRTVASLAAAASFIMALREL